MQVENFEPALFVASSYYELNMVSKNKGGNCWVLKERFTHTHSAHIDKGLMVRLVDLQCLTWNVWPPMFDLLFDSMTPCIAIQLLDRSWRLRLSRSWSTWSCRNCVSSGRGGASGGVNSLLELHEIAEVGGTCDARVVVMEVVVMEVQRIVNLGSRKHCCATGSGTTGCWLAMLAGSHTHTHTQTHTHTYTHTHTHTHNYTHLIIHSLYYLSFIAVPLP